MSRRTTLALLRVLRPLKRRRKRLPRQQQPDLIRLEYYHSILPFVRQAEAYWRSIQHDVFNLLRFRNTKLDDERIEDDEEKRARRLIEEAAKRAVDALAPTQLEEVAKKFGRRTNDFQRQQFAKQAEAALAIPLSVIERPVTEKLEGFAQENVELIKSVEERYFDRIKERVMQAFENGERPEDITEDLQKIGGMSDRDALRIANDQIGKINAEFNQERQEHLGVEKYIWRTMNDGRVRDEHGDREGNSYSWDDPPEDGHPGEAINCRCYAEPDFSDILGDI
jgi:SPP1 gp7 family putative phage head morphogenesis protein